MNVGEQTTLDPIDFRCLKKATETFLKKSSFWMNY